jgi:hypothetical protein
MAPYSTKKALCAFREALADFHPLKYGILVLSIVLLLRTYEVQAQFIQTSSFGTYQTPNGLVKIVLASQEGAQGIFVVSLAQPIPPQEFNVERIPTTGAEHVFIKFDANAEFPYSEIVLNDKAYKITGNLNLIVGDALVQLDNTNPYLTVTYRSGEKGGDAVVGFYGIFEVVKGVGNLPTIVGANQHAPEITKILKPYRVEEDALWLDEKKVENPAVGIFVRHEHVCLKDTTSILTLEQLRKVQATKVELQQAQLLDGFLKSNRKIKPLGGKLVLRAEPASPLVMLDMSQNVYDLRQIKNSFSKNAVCVISPLS